MRSTRASSTGRPTASLTDDLCHHLHSAQSCWQVCMHDDIGHVGYNAAYDQLVRRYIWPRMHQDLKDYISDCQPCRDNICLPNVPRALRPLPFAGWWSRVCLDCGQLSVTTGPSWFVVAVDYHTKWVEAVPLKGNPSSQQIADSFERHVLARVGPPKVVICDNGSEFRGKFKQLLGHHNILRCRRAAQRRAAAKAAATEGLAEGGDHQPLHQGRGDYPSSNSSKDSCSESDLSQVHCVNQQQSLVSIDTLLPSDLCPAQSGGTS